MLRAPNDKMVRATQALTKEEKEKQEEEERRKKLRAVWRIRYRKLPESAMRPPLHPDEIAKREKAWEKI